MKINVTEIAASATSTSKFDNFLLDVTSDFASCWQELLFVVLVTAIFSALIIFLLRIAAEFIIWSILLSTILIGFILSCFFSYKFATASTEGLRVAYGVGMAVSMVVTMIFVCVVFMVRKKIKMVIELFKEAGKTIGDVPSMLFQPFVVSSRKSTCGG